MTSIEIRDLEFVRKRGFHLGPITLELASGSRTALIGPSGCGKTTLLRCLAGLEMPSAGSIRMGDRCVFGQDESVPAEERRIGFVFQDGALWPHKSALGHLRYVAPRMKRREAKDLLASVGLAGKERSKPAQLSGGEGQRLALARALATDPDVLVLDEPLASVDVHLRDELAQLVRRVAQERQLTLLVVTHDRDEALAMADDIAILRDGQLVESGPAVELLRAPQTSFAASFLCKASCWPLAASADGRTVVTPFGVVDRNGAPDGPISLVVLPGETRLASADRDGASTARVQRVLPHGESAIATVELDGRTIEIPCDSRVVPGTDVRVELIGTPRLLASDRDPNGASA